MILTYKLQHPADIIDIKSIKFSSDESYIEFVIRRLLQNSENKIFNYLDQPKYWCHWITSRPESLLGIKTLLYRLFPFNCFTKQPKSSKEKLSDVIRNSFAPQKIVNTIRYDQDSIKREPENIVSTLKIFYKQIDDRIDELLNETDEDTFDEINDNEIDDNIHAEFNLEEGDLSPMMQMESTLSPSPNCPTNPVVLSRITSRYIIPRMLNKYKLSVEQLFILAENTYCPDCRFIKVLCENVDKSNEIHLKLFHDYFKGYLERNLLSVFNKNNVWSPKNYDMIKTIKNDSYYDIEVDHEIGLDMTFGWLFFVENCKEEVEIALKIIKDAFELKNRPDKYIEQFLDTFVSSLIFLDDEKKQFCGNLYKNYFPDYYLTTNIDPPPH